MSTPNKPLDAEALIQMEVDRAVAPYEGRVPAFMLAKLRELAERHWRERPSAMESIHRRVAKAKAHSGAEPAPGAPTTAEDDAAKGKDGKETS